MACGSVRSDKRRRSCAAFLKPASSPSGPPITIATSSPDSCQALSRSANATVATLVIKCRRALRQEDLKTLVIAGGVSANTNLRSALQEALAKEGARVFYPAPMFCTDNGAMIAYAGAQRLQAGQVDDADARVRPRWPMEELLPLSSAEVI